MSGYELHFTGPEAESLANDLSAFIKAEFGETPSRIEPPSSAGGPKPGERGVDPVAVAAVILAIPGAVLAIRDLVDRIARKKQMDSLNQMILKKAGNKHEVVFHTSDGKMIILGKAKTAEVLDMIEGEEDDG